MIGLVLLRPWWLLALLPIAGLALWLWRHRAAGEWAAIIDPVLLAAMRRLGHLGVGGTDAAPFLACAAAGLSRWRWRGRRCRARPATPTSGSTRSC
jgi:Ca-activated chloride channel family protein